MPRLNARALFLLLSLAALPALRAQTTAPAGAPLTIEEAVARAMQKNFDLKVQAFSTEIARETLVIAKTDLEPVFGAKAITSGSTTPGLLNDVRNRETDVRASVSQQILTGADVSLSTSLARSSTNPTAATLNPTYSSDVALSVVQPLLKGAGPTVARANIERSKLGVSIAQLDYRAQVLQVVRDTEVAYNQVVYARGLLGVKQHSLGLAERLLEENKTRKLTGVATDLDVLSAEVGVANARNGIVTAQQTVSNSEDNLLALIGQFEFDQPIGAIVLTEQRAEPVSFDLSYKLARDHQPDFLAAQAVIKQLAIDAKTAKTNSLPSLNLGGALGYNGSDRSYGAAFDRTTEAQGSNWQVDLTLTVPWGLRGDRARLRSAEASLRQQEARLQRLDQNLLVQVRAGVRAVEANRQSVEIYAKATQFAEKQYELELARFKAGLATSRQVLQTQDDLEAAKLNELLARVSLRTAVADLHQLESSSLERYRIALAE